MKKLSILICALCCISAAGKAQQLSSQEMVAITPMVPYSIDLPEDARKSLGIKLGQMATQNGFGSNSGEFVLTANVVVLDKQATGTAPVQFLVDIEVSVFVLGVNDGIVIDETSFVVQGIDRLENKAIIQAINTIKPKSPATKKFMDNVREQIIVYYNTRIPALVSKAQSLANRNDYYGALEVLSGIPECVDQYPMVAEMMSSVYQKMIDREAVAALQEAKGCIAVRDYDCALNSLLGVDPSSSHSKEAFNLIAQIQSTLDEKERREYEDKMRMYEDQKEMAQRMWDDKVAMTKQRIDAAKQVGTAQAKADSSIADKLNKWFLGKFK